MDLARKVAEKEVLIDKMERKFRKNHILRLNEGSCSAQAGMVFVDIVSDESASGTTLQIFQRQFLEIDHNRLCREMTKWSF